MTYEEKLDLVVTAIREAIKARRKGQPVKLYYTEDNGLTHFLKEEVHDILVQLQDEKIIAIQYKINRLLPIEKQPLDANYIFLDILEGFEPWYEQYLMTQKTNLENLDYITMLRVYDVILDINEQIQLIHKTTVHIQLLPPMIRFSILFPADSIGFRNQYCDNRLGSLQFLKEKHVIEGYTHGRNGWNTVITVSFVLSKFDEFYKTIKEEYKKRSQPAETPINLKMTPSIDDKTKWPDNFRWENKSFVFGEYGKLNLQSQDRLHILKVLTDKKGDWASVNELKGNKDVGYMRSTIKQIEDRLPEEAKKHIKIISTQEDDSEGKPASGAYRIKILQ